MKIQNKFVSALAAGTVAMSLLLGASTAQATTVILNGDNSVVGIEDLSVTAQTGNVTIYNVEFLTTTANDLYPGLVPQLKDENAMLARIAIDEALNANIPRPTGAGPANTEQYFIGAFMEEALMIAVGGEYESRTRNEWDWCRTDCLPFGVKALNPEDRYTFASFTVVPVPAAVWLFGSGLVGLIAVGRRKKA